MIFTQAQLQEARDLLIKAGRMDLANTLVLEVSASHQLATKCQAAVLEVHRLEAQRRHTRNRVKELVS